jgi:hypothetical protein
MLSSDSLRQLLSVYIRPLDDPPAVQEHWYIYGSWRQNI